MKLKTAISWLRCCRPSGADEHTREFRKALSAVQKSGLGEESEFKAQLAFDRVIADKMEFPLEPSAQEEMERYAEKFNEKRHHFRLSLHDPAVLAVGCSFFVILGLVVWVWLSAMDRFDGIEEVSGIALAGDRSQMEDFEPVEAPVGELEDWFVLQGIDGFNVPPGFAELGAVGVRTMEHEGTSIAIIAVPEKRAFFYVFPARAFGVDVKPQGSWRITEYLAGSEPKSLAVMQEGTTVFMIAFAGTKRDMEDFIRTKEASL